MKAGLLDSDGRPFRRNATYNLASYPLPLVVDGETNPAAVVDLGAGIGPKPVSDLLKCSQASAGVVLTDEQVLGSANALEFQVKRARWREALTMLQGVPLPETQILMAWTHKTQSITKVVDTAKNALLPGPWQQVRTAANVPEVLGPVFTATGAATIRALLQIDDVFCVALCQSGSLAGIPAGNCTMNGHATAQVSGHPLCGAAAALVAGRIGSVRAST